MARILPETAPRRLPKVVARVYHQLKQIDSEEVVCRLSYPLEETARPEFMVIYQDAFVFLLGVSPVTAEELETAGQQDLFDPEAMQKVLDLPTRSVLEHFIEEFREGVAEGEARIHKWILFPRVPDRLVERFTQRVNWPDYRLLGQESGRAGAMLQLIQESARDPLDEVICRGWLARFSPEARIPRHWVDREDKAEGSRSHRATQTDFFLDYAQESAVKRDLELSLEAEETVQENGLRLVTGVAGCGKTLVLLYRARVMARVQPGQRILVLTFNKPLHLEMKKRMRELDPEIILEERTFYAWVFSLLRGDVEMISDEAAIGLIERISREAGLRDRYSVSFLRSEFDWISDHAVDRVDLDWYLEIDRVGRQRALQKGQREEVFGLFRAYRAALQERGETDWAGLPVRLLQRVREKQIGTGRYDAIFIDEAQFFAPVWFACIQAMVHPQRGQIFMVADPTQGFLRQGQSWRQVLGRDLRGRSQRLLQPYRNPRPILRLATRFYRKRMEGEDDEVNLPDEGALAACPEGEEPRFILMASAQDEEARVVNEIREALAKGRPAGHLLVLHGEKNRMEGLREALGEALGWERVEKEYEGDPEKIRLCTLHACTGLEAPVVILLGFEHFLARERSALLEMSEQAELRRKHSKLLFVALTRATRRLLIFHRSDGTRKTLMGEE